MLDGIFSIVLAYKYKNGWVGELVGAGWANSQVDVLTGVRTGDGISVRWANWVCAYSGWPPVRDMSGILKKLDMSGICQGY